MSAVKISMLAVMGLVLILIVKQWKSDLLPLLRMGITILFATLMLRAVTPLLDTLGHLTEAGGIGSYTGTLLDALGIAVLCEICSGICRDAGESGIASGVELAGKVELLLLSLPLIEKVLSAARELIELGGGS